MKHNISTKSLLLICLVIYGGSSSAETLPTVIALFGDSTTVGYVPPSAGDTGFTDREGAGTTTRGTPTTHLSEILNEGVLKRPAVVANWGFGSSTTGAAPDPNPDPEEEPAPPPPNLPGNGLSRIDNDLASTKSTHAGSEYLVLIIYGTNDFVSSIDPGTTRFNILQMIIKARNQGFEPIIGTTLPRSDRTPSPNCKPECIYSKRSKQWRRIFGRSACGFWSKPIDLSAINGARTRHSFRESYLFAPEPLKAIVKWLRNGWMQDSQISSHLNLSSSLGQYPYCCSRTKSNLQSKHC